MDNKETEKTETKFNLEIGEAVNDYDLAQALREIVDKINEGYTSGIVGCSYISWNVTGLKEESWTVKCYDSRGMVFNESTFTNLEDAKADADNETTSDCYAMVHLNDEDESEEYNTYSDMISLKEADTEDEQ